MLNRERLRSLADVIEASDTYDQAEHETCIAGHEVDKLFNEGRERVPASKMLPFNIEGAAIASLGLPGEHYHWIFSGGPSYEWPEPYASEWLDAASKDRPALAKVAAQLLRDLADGKVEP